MKTHLWPGTVHVIHIWSSDLKQNTAVYKINIYITAW